MRRDPPPPPGGLGDVVSWARDLTDWALSQRDGEAPQTLLARTTRGVFRSAQKGGRGGGSEGAPLQWKGQWDAEATYAKDDIVKRDKIPEEIDDGNQAGDYIAQASVYPGDAPPGNPPIPATATAVVTAGVVTDLTLTFAGQGYSSHSPPNVTIISGSGGTGATAHATVNQDSSISLHLDTGGEGYSEGDTTVEIDPPGAYKWQLWSRFNAQKFTLRVGKARIVIDAGRQDIGGELPQITIFKDMDDGLGTSGSIRLSLQQLFDTLPAGVNADIMFREWDVCAEGLPKKAVFLSSAPYGP